MRRAWPTAMVAGARAALEAIARDLMKRETLSGDHVSQTIAGASLPHA
ncbi:hypothetical protein [Horticoccus sp. 23ND18S-11]